MAISVYKVYSIKRKNALYHALSVRVSLTVDTRSTFLWLQSPLITGLYKTTFIPSTCCISVGYNEEEPFVFLHPFFYCCSRFSLLVQQGIEVSVHTVSCVATCESILISGLRYYYHKPV